MFNEKTIKAAMQVGNIKIPRAGQTEIFGWLSGIPHFELPNMGGCPKFFGRYFCYGWQPPQKIFVHFGHELFGVSARNGLKLAHCQPKIRPFGVLLLSIEYFVKADPKISYNFAIVGLHPEKSIFKLKHFFIFGPSNKKNAIQGFRFAQP